MTMNGSALDRDELARVLREARQVVPVGDRSIHHHRLLLFPRPAIRNPA